MKARGQTRRERVSRLKNLKSLTAIRAEIKKGLAKDQAIFSSLEKTQRALFGIEGKPFLSEPEKKVMKMLDRAVLPGVWTNLKRITIKRARKTFLRKKYYEKYGLIRELFKEGNELGMVMVKPELYSEWHSVEAFLKRIGCKVLFAKNFVFGKDDIQRLYPHALADREKYYHFALGAANLMSAPSRVIVFQHPPAEQYRRLMDKPATERHPQNLFNSIFKAKIRGEIMRKRLHAIGFPKEGGEKMGALAKKLDLYGFFENNIPRGFDPMILINGVHIPDHGEIARDARTLLHLSELQAIKKKVRGVVA